MRYFFIASFTLTFLAGSALTGIINGKVTGVIDEDMMKSYTTSLLNVSA